MSVPTRESATSNFPANPSPKAFELCVVALTVAVSAVIAWIHIRSTSIWFDEGLTLLITSGHGTLEWRLGLAQFKPTTNLTRILSQLYTYDVHPPLYFWTLAIWRSCFGASLEIARMLSAIFIMGALILMYRFALQTPFRWPVVPVVIYACSAAGVRYAYNARPYAMASFLVVLTLCLVQRKSKWAGITAALCVATHYFAGLCVASVIAVACLLAMKLQRRWALLTSGSFVAFCLPTGVLVLKHVGARPGQFPQFGSLHREVDAMLGGALRSGLPSSSLGAWKYVLILGACLALLGGVWGIVRRFGIVPLSYGLFLCCFLATAIAANKSIVKMPADYYLGVSAPLFALLLWYAVCSVPLVAGPLTGVIVMIGVITFTPMMAPRDYRKLMNDIRADCDHCVVVVSAGSGAAVPACVLYEGKGLDIRLLHTGESPGQAVEGVGKDHIIYFIPAEENSSARTEEEFLNAYPAARQNGYYKVVPRF